MNRQRTILALALTLVLCGGAACAGGQEGTAEGTAPPPPTASDLLGVLATSDAVRDAQEQGIDQSYVVVIDPGTEIGSLARAWAILKPDLSRASPPMTVFELRLGTDFPPNEVLDLLLSTRGVRQAEANFSIPMVQGGADGEAGEDAADEEPPKPAE